MTTTDNWKVQWSFKTPNGDLVNVRANSAEELSVLLEGVAEVSGQASATSKAIESVYAVAPLSTGASTFAPTPPASSATTSAPTPQGGSMTTPTCVHGPRKYKSGVSQKTGNPYAFWSCPLPQGPEQCKPVN